MSTFLVTGGAGFIGSHIVRRLVRDGQTVRVLDNLSSGNKENLSSVVNDISFIEGDVRSEQDVSGAVTGVDYVIHQAAVVSIPESMKDPVYSNDVNINGILNLLICSRKADVKKFVFASSCAVYGDNVDLPLNEDELPDPISPYAVNKVAAEYYCRMFFRSMGLNTVCLRYFNVFGPGQDPGSAYSAVIPAFIERYELDKSCVIDGDGKQSRDFVFVEDVARANITASLSDDSSSGEVFNVGTGIGRSILDVALALKSIMNSDKGPEHGPERQGDIRDSLADISKTGELLGFSPEVGFENGLKQTVEWFKEKRAEG